MKASQLTAYTNAVNETGYSRFLDESRAIFEEGDKKSNTDEESRLFVEKSREQKESEKLSKNKVMQRKSEKNLLSRYSSPKEEREEEKKEVDPEVMNLLGRFALSPKPI